MASYQFLKHSNFNQVRNSHSGGRRRSTTQMCLRKILHTISSFPPPEIPKAPPLSPPFDLEEPKAKCLNGELGENNTGFYDVDLNVRLDSPPPPSSEETEQSESTAANRRHSAFSSGRCVREVWEFDSPVVPTGDSIAEKATDLFESEIPEIEDGVVEEVREVQRLKISNSGASTETTGEEECEITGEGEEHEFRFDGYLDLLIEAAKFISGEFEDSETEPTRYGELGGEFCGAEVTETEAAAAAAKEEFSAGSCSKRLKRSEDWRVDQCGAFEDVSPVVRSKRGRSQVLPYKYRDSILEPLKPLSRHRSSAVSTKRRRI